MSIYSFVEYSTVHDAEAAIQKYNGKDMGNNIKLVVKVSESKKHREERKHELMEERQFSKSLHCAKNNASFEQPESDEELSNPLQPRYIPPSNDRSPESKKCLNVSYVTQSNVKKSNSSPSSAQNFDNSKVKEESKGVIFSDKACKVCQKPAVSRCSRCKTAYCTTECQREDWPRHRNECTSNEADKGSNSFKCAYSSPEFSDESEIRIAEGSEDEGFVLDFPSEKDLVELKQVLHNTKTSDDLADLMAGIKITETSNNQSKVPSIHKQSKSDLEGSMVDKCTNLPTEMLQSLIPSATELLEDQTLTREAIVSTVPSPECFISVPSIYSQLQMLSKPLPSLPPLSSPPLLFQAIVTFISSLCNFNVLIPSVEVNQAIQFIRTAGRDLKPGSISAAQLTSGSKCGYKNKNDDFLRVSVFKVVSRDEVIVMSCDFGGRYSVPASELIQLPEQLVLIPNLTRRCVLDGVNITDNGKANLSRAITVFKDLVQDQPVRVQNLGVRNGAIVCTAMTSENDANMLDSLLRTKYVTKSEDGSKRLPLRLSCPTNKVEYHRIQQGSSVVILPTVVNNPCIIWATIDHPYLDNVTAMHKDLNHCYPLRDASFNPYVPAKGEICVAKYSQDQKYYRAEVLLVHHNGMVDVRFVETGHTENLTLSELYHIKPEFLTLPKQARRFCLSGVAPHQSLTWSDNAVAFIKSKVLNRHVTVNVLSVAPDTVQVEMFDPDLPNQLLNNSLILLGHAEISQPKKSSKTVSNPSLKGVNAFLTEAKPNNKEKDGSLKTVSSPSLKGVNAFLTEAKPNNKEKDVSLKTVSSPSLKSVNAFLTEVKPDNKEKDGSLKMVSSTSLKGVNAFLTEVKPDTEERDCSFAESRLESSNYEGVILDSPHAPVTQCSSDSLSSNDEIMIAPDMFFLSEGGFVRVCLSHLISLERFYVQLVEESHLPIVESVLGKIQSTRLFPLPKKHIKKGTVCLCRYAEDNEVHRSQIINVKDQKVTVVFKDYGNVFHCTSDVLYKITKELLDLPFQSISCSLNQVKNPAGSKTDWDPAAVTHFQKLLESGPLKARVVKVVGVLHVVDLSLNSSKGPVDVLSAMAEAGFIHSRCKESNSQKKTSLKKQSENQAHELNSEHFESPKVAIKRSSKEPENNLNNSCRPVVSPSQCNLAQSKFTIAVSDTTDPQSKSTIACSDSTDPIYPPCTSLETMVFEQSVTLHRVLITEVATLNEIYVQVVSNDSMSAMNSISQFLESSLMNSKNNSNVLPPLNSLCVAKYSEDHQWYRCKVESDDTNGTIMVQFIDYGNRDEVILSDVVPCPKECITVPVVAIRCSLSISSSMQKDEGKALKLLKEHVNNAESSVTVEVVSRDDNSPSVNIKVNDVDILQEMKRLGIIVEMKDSFPMVTTIKKMSLPSNLQNIRIVISEVVSPQEVYVQIASNEVKACLMNIGKKLNALLESDQSSVLLCPGVGSLCCARFSLDEHWYRATVKNNQGGIIEVQFIDYGNSESVVLPDIRACPKELCDYPVVAIKCELSGLQSLKTDEIEKVTQYLKQHTADMFFNPTVSSSHEGIPSLSLQNEKGITLLDELRSQNLFQELSCCLVKELPQIQLPENEFKFLIGEVHTPCNFYVQVATVENANTLDRISKGLNTDPSERISLKSLPKVGALCCARFSVDGQWYRAEVIAVKQDYCDVLFIDYGNFDKATLSNLAVCPPQLCSLPIQAVKCGLSGIPSHIESESGVIQYFQQVLCGVLLNGKVESSISGVQQLIISKDGKNVLKDLIALQVLAPCTTFAKELESVSLPEGAFEAIICEFSSPFKFYIQVSTPEVRTNLDIITNSINKDAKLLLPLSCNPQVGQLCCVQFCADNLWYRVEVTEVGEKKSKVFFVDFGNEEEVLNSELAMCPRKVAVIPKIAVECGLHGILPSSTKVESCVSYFQQNVMNASVLVEVIAIEKLPKIKVTKDDIDVLNNIVKPDLNSMVMVKDMDMVELPCKDSFRALVTEVVSSSEIYIQVATPDIGHLEKRISDFLITSKKCIPSSSPVVGALCCAKFSLDSQWYRAEIKSTDQTNVEVLFIDYGSMDIVSQDNLAVCPEEISQLPRIASRISLDGLPASLASSESITVHLKETLLGNLVNITVKQIYGASVLVDIMKNGNMMLDEMSSLGLLQTEHYNYVKEMTNIVLPESEVFEVLICSMVNHKEFYVQVATRSIGELLNNITEIIKSTCSSFTSFTSIPEVGVLCLAKFSDNEWYRAEVLELSGDKIQVKSLEYGNVESMSCSDLAVPPEDLVKMPIVAIECGLGNLHLYELSSDDMDALLMKHTDIILSAEVVGVINSVSQLKLTKNDVNIIEEISLAKTVDCSSLKQLECISLPTTGEFQVLITEIVSTAEFYVQLATTEVGNYLEKVTRVINSNKLNTCEFNLQPGSLCCAKFSQDEQWYRAKVLSVDGSLCSARFVDFGNKDTVPISDLAECPLECKSVPMLACPCYLEGFSLDKEVSRDMIDFFKEYTSTMSLISARAISYNSGNYELALFSSGESISKLILDKTPKSSYSWPIVSNMETIEIPSTSQLFPVSVTEISTLQKFYVQFATQKVAVMLNDITDGLQKHFDTKHCNVVNPPPVGSLCCAKYSKDSLWYRAEVQAVDDNNYSVLFLDYGNNDILPRTSLAECPSQFIDLPVLAVCCTVLDIPLDLITSVDATIEYLQKVSMNIETSMKIEEMVGGIPQVKLFWEGRDVLNILKEGGLIHSSSYTKANLPLLSFPSASQYVKCLVYRTKSLSEFYVHVNSKERSSILSQIENFISDNLSQDMIKSSVLSPSAGDLCLANFSEDKMWYRAKVKNVRENICDVLYLDYRNGDKVHMSKIVPCPESIASLPQVAIQCSLHGVPPSLVSSDELVAMFKDMVSNNAVFDGKLVCNVDGIPQIELVKDGLNVLKLLGIVSDAPMYSDIPKLQLPTSGDTFQVLVCELLSPSELFVQVNSEESISAIQKLAEKQNTLTDLTPLTSFPPIGSVCIAKFSQDDMWYRARVDSVSENKCNVFFFDYGNYERVALSEMVAIRKDWLEIPVVAISCSLHGLDNLNKDWSSTSCSTLKKLTSERLLNASVVSDQLGGNTSVQLSDITNGKLISVEFRNMIQPSDSVAVALRRCQVTEVNHPGSLYFQYLEADNANNLSLLNKLQEVYSNPAHYAEYVPTVGSLCCARFTEDMLWYRCKVLAVCEDTVKLSYIDFGTVEFVSKNDIYKLDDAFASQPAFAVHAMIRGIVPKDGGIWTKGAINMLSEKCEKVLFSSVVHQDTDINSVDLFVDAQKQSSIADILVSNGHACYVKN